MFLLPWTCLPVHRKIQNFVPARERIVVGCGQPSMPLFALIRLPSFIQNLLHALQAADSGGAYAAHGHPHTRGDYGV